MKKLNLRDWLIILVILFFVATAFYKVFSRSLANYLLREGGEHTKAVIIDKKNFLPNKSDNFTYSYKFSVGVKSYTNDSHNENLKIGDSIEVEYVKDWPTLNRPVQAPSSP